MIIKKDYANEFEVSKLDKDNEIQFIVEGQGLYVTSYLTIYQTIELIEFLKCQVDTFNKRMI